MKNCETCKHWVPPNDEDFCKGDTEPSFAFGACLACQRFWKLTEDMPDEIAEGGWNEEPTAEAKYKAATTAIGERELFACNDGSSYHAVLNTHAKFGCVRHETPT